MSMTINPISHYEEKKVVRFLIAGVHQNGEDFDLLIPSGVSITAYKKGMYDKASSFVQPIEMKAGLKNIDGEGYVDVADAGPRVKLQETIKWLETCRTIINADMKLDGPSGDKTVWFKFMQEEGQQYKSFTIWVRKEKLETGMLDV